MNTKQVRQSSMIAATLDYCQLYPAITSPLPNFSILQTNLTTTYNSIQTVSEDQAIGSGGTTMEKNSVRKELIAVTIETTRKLVAFAMVSKNDKLLKETDYSESDLLHQPDAQLPVISQLIHDRAQSHLAGLADYQVSAETQAALQQSIDDFNQVKALPRVEQANIAKATQQLKDLFAEADKTLAEMDALVEIIRTSQPEFYTGYRAARKVLDLGSRKVALKCQVNEALSGNPMAGVVISIWPNGESSAEPTAADKPLVIKKTAKGGGFLVKILDTGSYYAKVSKAGYTEQLHRIYINEGEMTLFEVRLSHA